MWWQTACVGKTLTLTAKLCNHWPPRVGVVSSACSNCSVEHYPLWLQGVEHFHGHNWWDNPITVSFQLISSYMSSVFSSAAVDTVKVLKSAFSSAKLLLPLYYWTTNPAKKKHPHYFLTFSKHLLRQRVHLHKKVYFIFSIIFSIQKYRALP